MLGQVFKEGGPGTQVGNNLNDRNDSTFTILISFTTFNENLEVGVVGNHIFLKIRLRACDWTIHKMLRICEGKERS